MKSTFLQEGVFRGLLALIDVQFPFIGINAEAAHMVNGCDMLIIIKCVSCTSGRHKVIADGYFLKCHHS